MWEGGLGIWGAIALGGVGAWVGCRRHGVPFPAYADAVAPGIVLAQAIGRWGNWFNQELYGRPTTLPWGLEIDRAHRPSDMLDVATYHPTFLGLRLNNWTSALVFAGAIAFLVFSARRHPGIEDVSQPRAGSGDESADEPPRLAVTSTDLSSRNR